MSDSNPAFFRHGLMKTSSVQLIWFDEDFYAMPISSISNIRVEPAGMPGCEYFP